ncbi:glutathione S-transferase [Nitrobacteraceae bacterium AZCC 2161]
MFELYHDWDAFCCIKVRFCLAEKGVPWVGRHIDLQRMEQLMPDYLALNPKGVVPTVLHDGRIIVESSVINEYIDECFDGPRLSPADPFERAQMRLWVRFEEEVLHPAVKGPTYQLMLRKAFAEMPAALIEERIAFAPTAEKAARLRDASRSLAPDFAEVEAARVVMVKALDKMEARLQQSRWFGGDAFSLADISIAPFVDRLEELNFAGMWSNKPAVQNWIARIKDRPGYREALPKAGQRIPAPLPLIQKSYVSGV